MQTYTDKILQLIIGYLIEVFSVFILIIQPNALTFLILYFIRGVGSSFISGTEEALIYESAQHTKDKDYKKIYSRFLSNGQFGFVFATAVAGVTYAYYGKESFVPLILASTFCFFVVSVVALFLDDYKVIKFDKSKGSEMFIIIKESYKLIKSNRIIKAVVIVGIATLSGEYFIQDVYQPYFETNNISHFWFGAALSLGTLLNGLALRRISSLEKKITIPTIIFWINIILGILYFGLATFISPLFLVGIYITMNGLFDLQQPILSDYINKETKTDIRATVLSGASFLRRLVQIFITFILAYTLSKHGIQQSLLIQGLYLILGGVLSYLVLISIKRLKIIYQ